MGCSYFEKLGFGSSNDKDGAIKFCLKAVLMDRSFDRLPQLLCEAHAIDGFGGDPGWMLERRSVNTVENEGWPIWASFKASVWGIAIDHPESFYSCDDFLQFVRSALNAYLQRYPEQSEDCVDVFNEMKRSSCFGSSNQC